MRPLFALLLMFVLLMTACAAPPTPIPQPTAPPVPPTATLVPPTVTPAPPTATATKPPTPTATPTKPPTPTATPRPKGWVTIKTAHAPSPRTGFAMTMLRDGRVLLFGGLGKDGKKLNDTWVFGPVGKALRQPPGINLSLALSAGIGGVFTPWLAPQSHDTMQATGEDWTQLNPATPPSARDGHRMATMPDGKVYLFGGRQADGTYTSDLHTIDLKAWQPITTTSSPPPGRYYSTFSEYGGNLFVAGGVGKKGAGLTIFEDYWRYEVSTSSWNELQKPPGYISPNAGTVVYDGKTYFVDPHAYDLTKRTMFVYDNGKKIWEQTTVQGNVPPGSRAYYSVVGVGDQAIVTGGELWDDSTKKGNPIPEVWVLDLKTFNYKRLGDMPFPVSGPGSVYDEKNDRMIIWGSDLQNAILMIVIGTMS